MTLALLFYLNTTPTIAPPVASIFVDEIDGTIARVVQQDRVFCVPASLLPVGTREGMTLKITITSPKTDSADLRAQMGRDDDGATIEL